MCAVNVDDWLEHQRLRQQGDMDCGVSVFAELTGFSREQIISELPGAENGKTVSEWEEYLGSKGFSVTRYISDQKYPLPCAPLVDSGASYHWIYQAGDGGIHDPSPVFQFVPPKVLNFSYYGARILSVAIA